MPPRKKASASPPIVSIKHKEKRANIPTEELRDFVAEDEKAPKTLLYPRDPSLDPQLVWKGKDEQDRQDLAVPVVPIYIQEKIQPQAIIEDLRAHAAAADDRVAEEMAAYQTKLFADFNGIESDFERKIAFYSHESASQPHWSNRMILGDSLLVMTSLAEKEGLKGKVQCIYLDPPYGIKFGSNWQVSTRKRDVKDGKAEDATRQPEQIRAFRDTWKLGIHSYLAYLRDRLVVARELLTETGSIFVQIGDENVHLVRCVMDEVFGSENFVSITAVRKTGGATSDTLPSVVDHLLFYAKTLRQLKYRQLFLPKILGEEGSTEYFNVEFPNGSMRMATEGEILGQEPMPKGARIFATDSAVSEGFRTNTSAPFEWHGITFDPGSARNWKASIQGMLRLCEVGRIIPRSGLRIYKRYFDDFPYRILNNVWMDVRGAVDRSYVVQTATQVIERCLLMSTDPGDLVLDPTCGSGTTAYVAEQWGRRWITGDTSRVALALARTRLMAAKYPYYLLADSPEGLKKEAEVTGKMVPSYQTDGDIKKGFVYKRVPHVTLKSIANNEEIDGIHAKWQPKQDAAREQLNKALKKSWQEWEVPRETEESWPKVTQEAHKEFWRLRHDRQQEIDASIARRAETELLYDQPHEDKKRLRVSGPFTVESLSPHRVLAAADHNLDGTVSQQEARQQQDFGTMILENLKKAGVQNTKKKERLLFDSLEPYAGTWINAQGTYTDSDGKSKRVAVSLGPEHGTVGPQQVKEAAQTGPAGRDRRSSLGQPERHHQSPLPQTKVRQDRYQSHQSLWRRGAESV